jgi:dTDP-4-amino-4,6-dideoxygalactose transaminase
LSNLLSVQARRKRFSMPARPVMNIPILELKPAYDELREQFDAAYRRVMESGRYLLGPELAAFEEEYARSVGAAHCVGVGNGLEALQLALVAAGVGPGDEVVVPSNGYIAAWLAVSHAGASPAPCEPDPSTHNLDPSRIEAALTPRTRAILPIHLYGQTADMDAVMEIAKRKGLFVLEDGAQAHGARCRGRFSGGLGHAAGISFYPSKNLAAFADAGAVTTGDAALAEKIRCLRNYGSRERYINEALGFNSRLDELQAAFLRVRLSRLPEWNERRRALARRYGERLRGLGDLVLPAVPPWAEPVWHVYVIRTARRDPLRRHLEAAGVQTQIHYPVPPHLSGAYAAAGWKRGDFPIAERLAAEVLSLPIGPHLAMAQVDRVCDAVSSYFAGH